MGDYPQIYADKEDMEYHQQMEEQAIDDGLISINQADLTQLMTLPGIGEVKAQAILEYRTQHGGFSLIEELRQVNGIGESIFSQIKNKIKI
jgi:competence protein ComEA